MAPSDVHVQTAGAWKEGEMARDPGGLLRRSLPGASNGAGRLQMAPNEQRGSRQPLSQTRPSRRSSQGRRAWLAAVARKIAERGCRKATPFGAGNRPTHGCGVGTRAPVAPSRQIARRGYRRWRPAGTSGGSSGPGRSHQRRKSGDSTCDSQQQESPGFATRSSGAAPVPIVSAGPRSSSPCGRDPWRLLSPSW